jgi:hypothetical protein
MALLLLLLLLLLKLRIEVVIPFGRWGKLVFTIQFRRIDDGREEIFVAVIVATLRHMKELKFYEDRNMILLLPEKLGVFVGGEEIF